jgi:hypothetical protein
MKSLASYAKKKQARGANQNLKKAKRVKKVEVAAEAEMTKAAMSKPRSPVKARTPKRSSDRFLRNPGLSEATSRNAA